MFIPDEDTATEPESEELNTEEEAEADGETEGKEGEQKEVTDFPFKISHTICILQSDQQILTKPGANLTETCFSRRRKRYRTCNWRGKYLSWPKRSSKSEFP